MTLLSLLWQGVLRPLCELLQFLFTLLAVVLGWLALSGVLLMPCWLLLPHPEGLACTPFCLFLGWVWLMRLAGTAPERPPVSHENLRGGGSTVTPTK